MKKLDFEVTQSKHGYHVSLDGKLFVSFSIKANALVSLDYIKGYEEVDGEFYINKVELTQSLDYKLVYHYYEKTGDVHCVNMYLYEKGAIVYTSWKRKLGSIEAHSKLINRLKEDLAEENQYILKDAHEYDMVYHEQSVGYGKPASNYFSQALDVYCDTEKEHLRLYEYYDDAIEYVEERKALIVIAENGEFVGNEAVFDIAIYVRKTQDDA